VRVPATARLREESDLLIDQLRAIDNRRLVQGPVARLPDALMRRVGQAPLEVLDLAE
jgi:mRNA interferase MazF